MIKDDNTRPESGFAPGSGENTEQKTTDFNERLKKAGDELLGGAKKDRERGRTAALKEVESLKVKLAEAEDQRLRAMAELENFRQRKNREIADQEKYAPMELARAILPIWDNIGRALDAAPDDESVRGFVDGVRMVHRQFLDVLAKNGVVRIDAEGKCSTQTATSRLRCLRATNLPERFSTTRVPDSSCTIASSVRPRWWSPHNIPQRRNRKSDPNITLSPSIYRREPALSGFPFFRSCRRIR